MNASTPWQWWHPSICPPRLTQALSPDHLQRLLWCIYAIQPGLSIRANADSQLLSPSALLWLPAMRKVSALECNPSDFADSCPAAMRCAIHSFSRLQSPATDTPFPAKSAAQPSPRPRGPPPLPVHVHHPLFRNFLNWNQIAQAQALRCQRKLNLNQSGTPPARCTRTLEEHACIYLLECSNLIMCISGSIIHDQCPQAYGRLLSQRQRPDEGGGRGGGGVRTQNR